MKPTLTPIATDDRKDIIDIFNFYVENSFAAYPEKKLPYDFFDTLLNLCQGYPNATVKNISGEVAGFGMLRPYNPMPVFYRTAEITYFIKPDFTGHGIGRTLLDYLVDEGGKKGITSIIAGISSLNEGSIRFHLKNGFVECGRFRAVGQKNGKLFDVFYCQKMI